MRRNDGCSTPSKLWRCTEQNPHLTPPRPQLSTLSNTFWSGTHPHPPPGATQHAMRPFLPSTTRATMMGPLLGVFRGRAGGWGGRRRKPVGGAQGRIFRIGWNCKRKQTRGAVKLEGGLVLRGVNLAPTDFCLKAASHTSHLTRHLAPNSLKAFFLPFSKGCGLGSFWVPAPPPTSISGHMSPKHQNTPARAVLRSLRGAQPPSTPIPHTAPDHQPFETHHILSRALLSLCTFRLLFPVSDLVCPSREAAVDPAARPLAHRACGSSFGPFPGACQVDT